MTKKLKKRQIDLLMEQSTDMQTLKELNDFLHAPHGKVEQIHFYEKRDWLSLSLEYVTVGNPDSPNYDELVFYITDMHDLKCYSLLERTQSLSNLMDDPREKLIHHFNNRIYCFKVFEEGKYILVGGESSKNDKPLQMLVKQQNGKYEIDNRETNKIPVLGHVHYMQVSLSQGFIFINDNVKHLQF